jgi:hypothetical protein
MKLKVGQYVRHVKFGWGTILEDDGKTATVYFRSAGLKKIADPRAAFNMIGGEPHKKNPAAY